MAGEKDQWKANHSGKLNGSNDYKERNYNKLSKRIFNNILNKTSSKNTFTRLCHKFILSILFFKMTLS